MGFASCAALLLAVIVVSRAQDSSDLITSLPGLETMPSFAMYSGYITVDESHGRNLFYFFAESQGNPKTDPIVLWMQGGPGCSSLIGMLVENGPLRVIPAISNATALNVSLEINGWSWNRFANVLYIDNPAGVGFSYSNTPADYNTNNTRTAQDNYAFLQLFFQKYPQFANNDFFITGESYGGDYVPQLATEILNGTAVLLKQTLKAIMIGNPVFSCQDWKNYANTIQVQLYYYHALIPYRLYRQWFNNGCDGVVFPAICQDIMNNMNNIVNVNNFDPDNLYTDNAVGNATLGVGPNPATGFNIQNMRDYWLNLAEVQEALHVIKYTPWAACCAEVGQSGAPCGLNYTNNWTDMMPTYEWFFATQPQLRILIYSGDVDIATCPHAYAQLCLASLERDVVDDWTAWSIPGSPNQTAGYVEVYDKYTYATVKGAGHEVPEFQPAAAYYMISNFITSSFP